MLNLVQSLFSPVRTTAFRFPPGGEELVAALKSGDFDGLDRALSERQEHDLRMWRFDALGRQLNLRPLIARWRAERPNSHNAAVTQGYSGVHWAWAARGGDWRPQNFGEFQRRLGEAEALLTSTTGTNAKDPAPWMMLVTVARGQQAGVEVMERYYKEATRRSGPSYMIGSDAVQSFASKWGAPAGMMESVVRSLMAGAPPGHAVHALAVEAATELVLARCQESGAFVPGMYTMPDVAALVTHSEQMWHRAPGRKPGLFDARAHSSLAFAHWCAGNTRLAAPHVEAVYPLFDEDPWCYTGNAAGAARRAAADCK